MDGKAGVEEWLTPTHVVLGSGLWPSDFCTDHNKRLALFEMLHSKGVTPIWKTTTYTRNHNYPPSSNCAEGTDYEMCVLAGMNGCFDVSWTSSIHARHYYDDFHFSEPDVYRAMNEQLL
eukprot:1895766-Ditylum_brightwellii.AAC.1